MKRVALFLLGVFFLTSLDPPATYSQQISKFDRDRAQSMLQLIASDVRKHYYDPTFHGVDWDARVRDAKERIDTSPSMNRAMSHIAGALEALDDSHTFFMPPSRPYLHDFGFEMQMIGDRCYVVRVRPQSDAESKGLRQGDQIVAVNGFTPDRDNLWKMLYVFNFLRPQPAVRLVLRDPTGSERQTDVMAKMRESARVTDLTGGRIWDLVRDMESEQHLMRLRTHELGDDLLILKLPVFDFSEAQVGDMIGKARKHKALLLDLRSDPGGSVETLKHLLGGVFDKDVRIADRKERDSTKPLIAKSHHNSFNGKLIVLLDSKSASASEVFARVVQIEKRGTILGDHSSGSVMEAKHYDYKLGMGTMIFFSASITDADLIMSDGRSLEHQGVLPDEIALPTAADLASGRDPVLSRAADILGVKITPEEAGKLFPYEWPKEAD